MLKQERIAERIESAGYRVTGSREEIGNDGNGPLTVIAEDCATGERHTVSTYTKGAEGEIEALRNLAQKLGIPLDDDK